MSHALMPFLPASENHTHARALCCHSLFFCRQAFASSFPFQTTSKTMGFSKKSKEKKKKGPKGKRARAKAKLERQWGEVADESPQVLRRGKSRLLQQQSKKAQEEQDYNDQEYVKEQVDVNMSSDESDEEEEQVGGALNLLLQSIQQTSSLRGKRRQHLDEEDDGNTSSSGESESKVSARDDYKDNNRAMKDQDVMSDDDADNEEDECVGTSEMDPFSRHFNREALSERELANAIDASQQMTKVSSQNLDSCLELHVNSDADMSQVAAVSLFAHNRKVLKQAWKHANAEAIQGGNQKLSPLQQALYPALATYKDVFVSTETRKVSSHR